MRKGTIIDLLIKWEQSTSKPSTHSTRIKTLKVDAYQFLNHPCISLKTDSDDITFDELSTFGSTTLACQVWQEAVGNLNTYTSQVESALSPRENGLPANSLEAIIGIGSCKTYILDNPKTRHAIATTSSFFYQHVHSAFHWIEKFNELGCTSHDLFYLSKYLEDGTPPLTDRIGTEHPSSKLKYLINTNNNINYAALYKAYQLTHDFPLSSLSKLFLLSGNPGVINYAINNFNELDIYHDDTIMNLVAFSGSVSGFIFTANHFSIKRPSPSILIPASYCNNLRLFHYLLYCYQISSNTADKQGWKLIHHAAKIGNIKKLTHFQELGCTTGKTKYHEHPIHIAAQFGNLETLKFLVHQGHGHTMANLFLPSLAQTEATDQQNITYNILLLATRFGHLNIVQYLLTESDYQSSIRSNQLGNLLHLACISHNIDLVRYLIDEQGYDITEKNKYGHNAFHFAASSGCLDILMLLDNLNSALASTIDDEGSSALFLATSCDQKDIIYYLVALGLDPNKTNRQGNTPLHFAAYFGRTAAVTALLDKNASKTIQNQAQQDALTYALSNHKMKEGMKNKLRYLFANHQIEPEAAPSAPMRH